MTGHYRKGLNEFTHLRSRLNRVGRQLYKIQKLLEKPWN